LGGRRLFTMRQIEQQANGRSFENVALNDEETHDGEQQLSCSHAWAPGLQGLCPSS
jgi:hypothetical protein